MHKMLQTIMLTAGLLGILAAPVAAQTAELQRRTEPYIWFSGTHDGGPDRPHLRVEDSIAISGVPWMQLRFAEAELGQSSYLEITSLADGATQHLDAERLGQWRQQSAYFNGDAVQVRLFVGARDRGVQVSIEQVVVGEWGPGTPETICGVDDRIASSEPRVGRIDPIGCTGWVAINGQLLTAGHCLSGSAQILSFNVPQSLPNGTVQFPGPEDQYTLDQTSFLGTGSGVGNDWGVFDVFNNSQTGLQPLAAQGGFNVKQDLGPAEIRITGFGVDSGTTNQTNQTNAGPNAGSSGTVMRYVTDTTGGNSGSPVIAEATDEPVGSHTHGGCSGGGGNNDGTS
ncbi:MAG: hypothetical protein GY953_42760, partial [bacterium]|nr:hypothetical protein [bacterium]